MKVAQCPRDGEIWVLEVIGVLSRSVGSDSLRP